MSFRNAHERELRTTLRSGLYQSIFSWTFGLGLVYATIPEQFLKFSLIVLLALFIPFGIIIWCTYRQKFEGHFQAFAAFSNILAGMMVIYFCHHFPNGAYIMLMVLILVVFFGTYLYRFQFLVGAFVTLTYIGTFQIYILFISDLEPSQIWLLSSVAWLTQAFSLSLGYVSEKNHRNSFIQQQTISQQKDIIEKERNQSDKLLLNILPFRVAQELKETGKAKPRRFENVTLLFTDFQGFTELVASISAITLVEELNDIFSHFDDIMEAEGVEKIETIGDAYLAAGGLPEEVPDHAKRCVLAAKRMIDFLEERNSRNPIKWKMRVGIHSGPIVAGVVGKNKFAYDLFGDTINTASRIESAGTPGKINISASTYDLIKREFDCTPRGEIHAKGKGNMNMYFVE
jgi:class 3 adenylate cyclase